jgi:hypothetical protein
MAWREGEGAAMLGAVLLARIGPPSGRDRDVWRIRRARKLEY